MNENQFLVDQSPFLKFEDKKVLMENSSHLYEQINGKFINVTEKAGF